MTSTKSTRTIGCWDACRPGGWKPNRSAMQFFPSADGSPRGFTARLFRDAGRGRPNRHRSRYARHGRPPHGPGRAAWFHAVSPQRLRAGTPLDAAHCRKSSTPPMTPNCELRATSTVSPQALYFVNGDFVASRRRPWPGDRQGMPAGNRERQFRAARTGLRQLAHGPRAAGGSWFSQFSGHHSCIRPSLPRPKRGPGLKASTLGQLCHAFLISNGFLYVELKGVPSPTSIAGASSRSRRLGFPVRRCAWLLQEDRAFRETPRNRRSTGRPTTSCRGCRPASRKPAASFRCSCRGGQATSTCSTRSPN